MGYRSEVAYAFYSIDDEYDAVVKLWLDENLPFDDWDGEHWIAMEGGYKFYAAHVKWYEDAQEVRKMEEVARRFRDSFIENNGYIAALEYVRIGENNDDNEEIYYGNSDYILSVSRSIHGV